MNYTPKMSSRLMVEAIGTFWLVLVGVGSAVLNGKFLAQVLNGEPIQVGVGHLGVALAFGLGFLTIGYAMGHVSGAHFNPAVTFGVAFARRMKWSEVPGYLIAQVVGGLVAGAVLAGLLNSKGLSITGNMAANGFGEHSPGGYGLGAVLCFEAIVTAFFVYTVLGTTRQHAPSGFAPLTIGLALTAAHLIAIPVSNASVNPARSTAVAFFNGDGAPGQLWAFWLAPLVGGIIAGVTYAWITGEDRSDWDIDGVTHDPRAAARDAEGNPVVE